MPKFVVGTLNQGVSTLVDENHQVVEFPSHLLPPDVYVGCVVEFTIAVKPEHQKERLEALNSVFDAIEVEASSEQKRARRKRHKEKRSKKSKSSHRSRSSRERSGDGRRSSRRGTVGDGSKDTRSHRSTAASGSIGASPTASGKAPGDTDGAGHARQKTAERELQPT